MNDFLYNSRKLSAIEWLIDVSIALAACAFTSAQMLLTSSSFGAPDDLFRQLSGMPSAMPQAGAYLAVALTTLPLLARRKSPWLVFIFIMMVFLGTQRLIGSYTLAAIGPVIGLFTLAHDRSRIEVFFAAGFSALAIAVVDMPYVSSSLAALVRLQDITYMAAAVLGGFALRGHQDYVAETEQRAIAAERSREEEAARRVEEERVRIAREIHDITAHSLSAVSIQAAAAERLLSIDPASAQEAIRSVRATSKNALDEIRSMIGVLRSNDVSAEMAPTAGTERMLDVVSYLEDAGMTVSFDSAAYDRSRVPIYIDIALFGIAREAATNIVKHAQASNVSIRLAVSEAQASLVVEDDGRGCPSGSGLGSAGSTSAGDTSNVASTNGNTPTSDVPAGIASIGGSSANMGGSGHGIQGMRERVHLLQGELSAGNRASRGFSVRASIPLDVGRKHG